MDVRLTPRRPSRRRPIGRLPYPDVWFFFQRTNLVTFVSLWNAYSRANVEEAYCDFTHERVEEQTLFSLLPIVGVEVEF